MEQRKNRARKGSSTKIIPPKKQSENLSRDEVRSINKKKLKRKRKMKKAAALIALALVIVCISVILVLTVFFKVNKIVISGPDVYPDNKIIEQSNIELGSSLFGVNEKEINELLTQRLPYIKSVKITRKLPDTVNVQITSTTEIAAVSYGTGYVLVDETGKVLSKASTEVNDGVAVVNGVKVKSCDEGKVISFDSEEITENFILLIQEIKSNGLEGITEIVLADNKEFKAVYDNRIIIKFGSMDDLEVKIQRAKYAIDKENQNNPYYEGVLDLQYESQYHFSPGTEEELTISPEFVTDENGKVLTDEYGNFVTHPSTTTVEGEQEEE